MTAMHTIDRVSIGALALADVGTGLLLIAAGQGGTLVHTVVGVVALLLALPAAATAITGRLPQLADEGVLVNVGALVFITVDMAFTPTGVLERVGLVVLLAAATSATAGLYVRLFGLLRLPRVGRHHDVD